MACPSLSFLPTNRSAIRRSVPYSQARRPAMRRCNCPSPSTLARQSAMRWCYCPNSSSRGRQLALRRCRTPPNPLPPYPGPVHVDWAFQALATRLTTHSPSLRTGFIADRTAESPKRLLQPSSESVGLRSSSAGFRSRALVLLGSLHVEHSSWRRENHPPLQQLAPPLVPVDRVEVSFILPPTLEKQNTWEPPTPRAVRTVTCTGTGRWEALSGIRRDRWETTDPRVQTSSIAARAKGATSRAAAF